MGVRTAPPFEKLVEELQRNGARTASLYFRCRSMVRSRKGWRWGGLNRVGWKPEEIPPNST